MSDPIPPTTRRRFPLRPPRALLAVASLYAGVLLPAICFMLVAGGPPDEPQWQTGRLQDFAWLLLGGSRTWVFYPFLIYPATSLLITFLNPQTASRYFVARFGVYSGVLVALHYVYVLGLALSGIDDMGSWSSLTTTVLGIPLMSLIAIAAPFVGWFLLWGVIRVWQSSIEIMVLAGVVGFFLALTVVLFVAVGTQGVESLSMVPIALLSLLILGSLASAPTWAAAAYAYQSIQLWRLQSDRLQWKLWQALTIFTWLAAYLATWRAAVMLMLQAYAQLPTEPPDDCYIATAAARGHGHFVGSREVLCRNGSTRRVNLQLAYFKCGELILKATVPRLHETIRCMYDTLGPHVARLLIHPLVADVAYLALKPLEWLTRVALAVLVGNVSSLTKKMYGGGRREKSGPRSRDTQLL